ncbi:hypothetical protein EDD36DRAFT_208704 [Exophiala viscosa]|uniref:Uncharacterized protein n=1 Tax=Exophiala viscosa TaxID=2486360 RepID=A0AAN6DYF6_9EURO|nr:hypothetical protein EDD36DRAFT_208704 [Exophiala viscosa]
MASEKAPEKPPPVTVPESIQTGRTISPSPGLRQRAFGRTSTFAEENARQGRRSSSFLSESLSDTRKSLRSSTTVDDILLPRPRGADDLDDIHDESSHWQSLPLGLALLPAVGGLFFKNGSAIVTDVTLLGLAAIFMNWALRSPWDWYRAAQSQIPAEPNSPTASVFSPVDETEEDADSESKADKGDGTTDRSDALRSERQSAQKELRFYELTALLCCFTFPLLGAWLLHAIRSQLSRPSEGLVSDYNLTIFMLVAEIRPLSHLIKMVQRRTLFVQRKINVELLPEAKPGDPQQLRDVSSRLEELEAHVANRIAGNAANETPANSEALAQKASASATADVKKAIQPELDALNRAMRRYEKRTTISAVQFEARLQDLEGRLHDVVSLAAAAQRNADRKSDKYAVTLANWISAVVVVPTQSFLYLLSMPGRLVTRVMAIPKRYMVGNAKGPTLKEGRQPRRNVQPRPNERERRPKG